jgi:hypothetical protein
MLFFLAQHFVYVEKKGVPMTQNGGKKRGRNSHTPILFRNMRRSDRKFGSSESHLCGTPSVENVRCCVERGDGNYFCPKEKEREKTEKGSARKTRDRMCPSVWRRSERMNFRQGAYQRREVDRGRQLFAFGALESFCKSQRAH